MIKSRKRSQEEESLHRDLTLTSGASYILWEYLVHNYFKAMFMYI